jgi:glycosyltransferase involved in cell wall biosynthesis
LADPFNQGVMLIAYDATTLKPGQSGIGYYTEHLLRHLLLEAPHDRFLLCSNRPIHTSLPLPAPVECLSPGLVPLSSLWLQLEAPLRLKRYRPQLLHFTNSVAPLARLGPTVVTIHDMSLTLLPQFHPWRRRLTRSLVRASLRRADAVITVSRSAARDLVRLLPLDPSRVHVIPEAPAEMFRPIREPAVLDGVRRRYGLPDRFILSVGTLEPRKNLVRLVEAYLGARRRGTLDGYALVLVGRRGWYNQELDRVLRSAGPGIILTGYVPFQDLPAVYNLSTMFVFPSLYEGFGLPVLEAMACGIPVVTSLGTALEEIAEGAAKLADPLDVESIAAAIESLAAQPELRQELARRGIDQAARFSWSRAARETLEVYRRYCSLPPPSSRFTPEVPP